MVEAQERTERHLNNLAADFRGYRLEQRRTGARRGMLVTEISGVVARNDVDRAVRRAAVLRRAGFHVIPAVPGDHVPPLLIEAARDKKVVVFEDGRVTGWDEALTAWAS